MRDSQRNPLCSKWACSHLRWPDSCESICRFARISMPNMTGRPGYRTMEMKGGSSALYLACTPCVPLFVHCLIRVETEGLLDYQGRAGIISIVRWNLRPVIFAVENRLILANRFRVPELNPFFCESRSPGAAAKKCESRVCGDSARIARML